MTGELNSGCEILELKLNSMDGPSLDQGDFIMWCIITKLSWRPQWNGSGSLKYRTLEQLVGRRWRGPVDGEMLGRIIQEI
eukprot:1344123-Amorphochlora_amoeboformis.AAC.1